MEDGHRAHLSSEAPLASAVPPVAPRVRGLPDVSLALAGRQRGRAWMLSLAVHGGILALALWGFGREVIAPSPAVRLVFVAPPSSAPLGMPEGTGRAPAAEVPPPAEEIGRASC